MPQILQGIVYLTVTGSNLAKALFGLEICCPMDSLRCKQTEINLSVFRRFVTGLMRAELKIMAGFSDNEGMYIKN